MYKYLNFFNKKGEYCNFEYIESADRWVGRIDFNTVSEGLIDDYQLYILEEVYNSTGESYEYSTPIKNVSLVGPTSQNIQGYFKSNNPVTQVFIYDFDLGATSNTLNKIYSMEYESLTQAYSTGTTGIKEGIKEVTSVETIPIQINIGFSPEEETSYSSIFYIKDSSDHILAEILIYGEGEEEDERLRDWLAALGADLLQSDEMIFDESDVNEIKANWSILNKKRKEMMLEYSNIYPYAGSYRGLINVIKFFGYQNLRMKEYWLNVDSETPYFGKFKQIDISDVFSENADFNTSSLIPSKIYKKTNKFGLFYDITAESGEYDESGVPIAEEVFQYSPQEILIKIYALKRKLQNYFLPVNAKIVDIIGEAVYFAKYDTNIWNDQYRIDKIELGLKPSFEVLPSVEGILEDLRYLYYFGCPIGPDLSIGGYSNILSWSVTLNPNDINVGGILSPLDTIQTFRFTFDIPTGTPVTVDTEIKRDTDTGKYIYTAGEVANLIINSLLSNSYISSNFVIYQESGNSGIIRIVQRDSSIGDGTIYVTWKSNTSGPFPSATTQYTSPTILGGGGTATSINVSPGPSGTFGPSGAPISYFADCFLGYFDNMNIPIKKLNDDEDIPIGYPITLNNTTFDITWEDADVTFNQIDQIGSSGNYLFGDYLLSQTISGWTSSPGSTSNPIYSPISGFPYGSFPSQFLYSWQNIGYYGYYEMQWIVSKEADETPAFLFDTGKITIEEGDNFPVILPYVGNYKVELYMWDSYNTKSFLINENMITVKMKESDFIGWYQFRELEYNLDTRKYKVQSDVINHPLPGSIIPPPPLLTWDEYDSTWDLPLHPNEAIQMADLSFNSLDSTEFYQSIVNPSTDPLIDRFPYTYNLMTLLPKWDDLYHLWWDGTGTKITQWEITGVTGPTAYLFMTKGNTILDLNSINVYYEQGPTGYTGATGITGSVGNTGDIIVSNANRRTYLYDGSQWVYITDKVDSYEFGGLTGSTASNILEMTRQLNQVMPNDGVEHPYLNDFIYYYEEEYDNSYSLIPYIRSVSKDFDRGGRHKIKFDGATGDKESYETVYFGYIGDIPSSFEIYKVETSGPTGSILINGMTNPYLIGSTNLSDLTNELNGPTAQSISGINRFEYNLVLGYSGATGPTSTITGTPMKIQAISKAFTNPEEISVVFDKIVGTTYGRSIIKNPTWDQVRILKYAQELPLCTVVNFTYDNSKVNGKKNPVWKLTKEGDSNFPDIYYNNKYFSYMFNKKGSYTLSLQLEDTNGNKKEITKKEIIKII